MSLPTVKSALCPVLMRVPPLLLHSSASLLPLQGEAGCLLPGTVVSNAPAVTASVHVSVERVSPSSRCARGRQRGQQPHGWDLGLQSIPATFCFSLKKVLISLHYLETLVYFLTSWPESRLIGTGAHTRPFRPQAFLLFNLFSLPLGSLWFSAFSWRSLHSALRFPFYLMSGRESACSELSSPLPVEE